MRLPSMWSSGMNDIHECGMQVVKARAEALAKAQFASRRDAHDCALMYIALGKKQLLLVSTLVTLDSCKCRCKYSYIDLGTEVQHLHFDMKLLQALLMKQQFLSGNHCKCGISFFCESLCLIKQLLILSSRLQSCKLS